MYRMDEDTMWRDLEQNQMPSNLRIGSGYFSNNFDEDDDKYGEEPSA